MLGASGLRDHCDRELEVARSVADEVVRPNVARWDREAIWPEPALRALQREGLGGLVVPVAAGGAGLGLSALTRVCEVLGHADASTALCFGMHCVATACIAAKGTEDQAERFLAPIAAGRHLTSLALSESGTGSHFYLPRCRMQRRGAEYVVSGSKSFVTSGGHADSYVVSTVADEDDAPPGHFSLVLVPGGDPGLRWGEPWDGWGMRGNSSRNVELASSVPVANRLGAEGDQIWYVFSVVAPYFLAAMAGTYLGVTARAVDEARQHLKQRHYAHSGGRLSEVGVLQHKLGKAWATFERTRHLCHGASAAADAGEANALLALCAAKAEAASAVVAVVNECMTMTGGIAYRAGAVLTRLMRDARAADVMSPTTDLLHVWMGRALLDLPLLGE